MFNSLFKMNGINTIFGYIKTSMLITMIFLNELLCEKLLCGGVWNEMRDMKLALALSNYAKLFNSRSVTDKSELGIPKLCLTNII